MGTPPYTCMISLFSLNTNHTIIKMLCGGTKTLILYVYITGRIKYKKKYMFMKYQSCQADYEPSTTCFAGSIRRESEILKYSIIYLTLQTSVPQLCYIFQSLSLHILTASITFCQSSVKRHFKFIAHSWHY